MSKKDLYRKMPASYVKLLNRYVKEVLHESPKEVEKRAFEIYTRFYNETPGIGGGDNPMADNLYSFMTCVAYFEATDWRMNTDCIPQMIKWKMDPMRVFGDIFNFNRGFGPAVINMFFRSVIKKTEKKNSRGEWGNTWKLLDNPEHRTEGCCYTLVGCPLVAFAKAHGYMDIMPPFCATDHAMAHLLHARLIRLHTEATGSDRCDYWFVGDKSEAARQYADLPEI